VRDHNDESDLEIKVKSKSTFSSNIVGCCFLTPAEMHEQQPYDQWIQLFKEDSSVPCGELRIQYCIGSPTLDSILFVAQQKAFSEELTFTEEFGSQVFATESHDDDICFIDRFGTRVFDVRKRDTSRRVFQVEPIFDVFQAGTDRILASVSRKVSLLKVEFFLEIMGERVISQRDKWNGNISLVKEDGTFVAYIKKPTVINKTLSVEVAPSENVPLILAISSMLNNEDTQMAD